MAAAQSPHKWAWYFGDPADYPSRLSGKTIGDCRAHGGMVEVDAGGALLLFSDGVVLRYHRGGEPRPPKHQLLIEFSEGEALSASVQMYGGLWCFAPGEFGNPYYDAARTKPSPLTEGFDDAYFGTIVSGSKGQNLSAKALLATEQRIPGVGNGVLQDILFAARINPRRKVDTFSPDDVERLFVAIRSTLGGMTVLRGRDTERDLYGQPGGYQTRMSKNTAGCPCPACGALVLKEAYLGGSVYYCPTCQPV